MAEKDKGKGTARELERAGALCLAFANVSAIRRDDRRRDRRVQLSEPLASYARLVSWSQSMGTLPPEVAESLRRAAAEQPEDAAAVLARAVGLSAALLRVFTAVVLEAEPSAEDVALLNRVLRKQEVVAAGGWFQRGWSAGEAALDRMLWPVAESAAELLTSDRLGKLRQCASAGCSRLFIYANSRRRWCDENTCGNRAKGKRYHDMVRRANKAAAGKSYDQMSEDRERRMEATQGRLEELSKKKEWLVQLLKEAKAVKVAERPSGETGGSDIES